MLTTAKDKYIQKLEAEIENLKTAMEKTFRPNVSKEDWKLFLQECGRTDFTTAEGR